SGFKRGGAYSMCVAGKQNGEWQVHDFDVFCPKALAGIGDLPDTVSSRSIPIRMRPKLLGESVERLRGREAKEEAAPLVQRLESWTEAVIDLLREGRPDLPACLGNRAVDVWEPLIVIADLAGGEWHQSARDAAA